MKRIVILNNDIYEVSDAVFRRIFPKTIPKTTPIPPASYRKEHKRHCEIVRKHGKIIAEADLLLRDD